MTRKGKMARRVFFAAVVVVFGFFAVQQGLPYLEELRGDMSYDEARDALGDRLEEVQWEEQIVSGVTTVAEQADELAESLPPISSFPMAVAAPSGGVASVEIFVSTEKSGTGTDGWMTQAAQDFNDSAITLSTGRAAKVQIRKIASGTGYEFIASGKYRPDAFSPSNHLWIQMAAAHGVTMTPIRERTVRNVAGLVMKTEVADRMREEFGALSVPNIVAAVVQRKMATGYTNPYASSTGLNFLVTVLETFAEQDEAKLQSPAVVSAFEGFQRGVPFVALTTLQMRDSVRQDGSLDAFVMEYQTYIATEELQSGYEFVPFGLLHDNPLYAVGQPGAAKMEALELFAKFLEQDRYRQLARELGFEPPIEHEPPFALPSGRTLIAAQKVWKEKKDAGRPIAAVFVSDVSGSMDGTRIRQLKDALTGGSGFIQPANSIGLVQFSDRVTVLLPIKPFELLHKSAFHAAVQRMQASGGTAMYDGIAVALRMLAEEKERRPEVKPMLFVLTDGETNRGLEFAEMRPVIRGLGVPVYTIGFEADLEELGRVSSLVEAASLTAEEGDLRYKIGALLNSQM